MMQLYLRQGGFHPDPPQYHLGGLWLILAFLALNFGIWAMAIMIAWRLA